MKVFEPMKINGLELKNRMVVSAMVTNYCTPDGKATEKFIAYHEHKAKGGCQTLCRRRHGQRHAGPDDGFL